MTATPLQLWRGTVPSEWLDYNGHMTEHRYLQIFGEASDALYGRIGVDFAVAAEGAWFTLETHIRHVVECKLGEQLSTETEILGFDTKRLHVYHRLYDTAGTLLATGEHLSIHVRQGKSCPAPPRMQAVIAQIFEDQRTIPRPQSTGSVLRQALVHSR